MYINYITYIIWFIYNICNKYITYNICMIYIINKMLLLRSYHVVIIILIMIMIMIIMVMIMMIQGQGPGRGPNKKTPPRAGPAAVCLGSRPWPLALDHHDQDDDDYIVTT